MDRLSSGVTTQGWVTTLLVEVDALNAYLGVGEVAILTGSYALHNDLDNICDQVSSRLDHRFCCVTAQGMNVDRCCKSL